MVCVAPFLLIGHHAAQTVNTDLLPVPLYQYKKSQEKSYLLQIVIIHLSGSPKQASTKYFLSGIRIILGSVCLAERVIPH